VADFDVIIVGAGAAGIAAARQCRKDGLSYCVLEARDRLGGRAYTKCFDDLALDMGCGWLHSADRNPMVSEAEALGFAIDRELPPWQKNMLEAGFSLSEQQDFRAEQAAFYARLEAAAQRAEDAPASDVLIAGQKWSALIDAISTYINGTELDRLSTKDFIAYHDSEVNWRLPRGYGALFRALADGLDVRLNCPVRQIDHSGTDIKVMSRAGTLSAQAAIICVPTAIIARGDLRFTPALPRHIEAAHHLPLGVADKIFLRLDHAADFPVNGRLMGRIGQVDKGSYHLRPFGRALIEGYFGGQYARELEREGPQAFFAHACDEIADCLGADIKKRLHFISATAWALDPFAMGSYSHALPGHADARAVLLGDVDERIFFAGEAVSAHDFSTAHGAWMTGKAAVKKLPFNISSYW
jgi:monoamine oxidase